MRSFYLIIIFIASCTTPPKTAKLGDDVLVGRVKSPQKYKGLLWYNIYIDTEIKVALRLLHPPGRTRFYLPLEWGGRRDLGDHIHINSAKGPRGPLAFTIDRGEGLVEIDARNEEWVELQYTVDLDGKDRVHPQKENENVFAFIPSILIRPSSSILDKLIDFPVEIHAPKDWNLVSTWPLQQARVSESNEKHRVWSYLIPDPTQLVDAFINAGPRLKIRTLGNVSLVMDETQFPDSENLALFVKEVVNSFSNKLGPVGPISVIVRRRRRKNEGYFGMGRRGGFVIELDNIKTLKKEAKILIAHEAFHLWNGHSIIASEQSGAQTRWFKEGLTEYVAIKKLFELGYLSRMELLDELAAGASTYWSNPVRENHAIHGEDAEAFSYDRGLLLAFAFDTIQAKISHDLSIEDWLLKLAEHKEATYPGYTPALLKKSFFEWLPSNEYTRTLWHNYVDLRGSINLRELFVEADLHYLPRRYNRRAKLVEIKKGYPLYERLFSVPVDMSKRAE